MRNAGAAERLPPWRSARAAPANVCIESMRVMQRHGSLNTRHNSFLGIQLAFVILVAVFRGLPKPKSARAQKHQKRRARKAVQHRREHFWVWVPASKAS